MAEGYAVGKAQEEGEPSQPAWHYRPMEPARCRCSEASRRAIGTGGGLAADVTLMERACALHPPRRPEPKHALGWRLAGVYEDGSVVLREPEEVPFLEGDLLAARSPRWKNGKHVLGGFEGVLPRKTCDERVSQPSFLVRDAIVSMDLPVDASIQTQRRMPGQ